MTKTISTPSALDTIDAVLARRAAEAPDALAFAEGGERLSYGGLRAEAGALAGGLARLGVGRGDRVVLFLPAGLDFIRVFFALQRLGAAPCAFAPGGPLVHRRPPRRAGAPSPHPDRRTRDRGASRELTGPGCAARNSRRCRAERRRRQSEPGEEEIAFLQPTSGTSGEARAAMIAAGQCSRLARAPPARCSEIGPRDVLVSWVPPWHDLGLLRFVLGPVYFGTPCHLVPPAIRTLPLWLRTASEVRATLLGAPDFALAARHPARRSRGARPLVAPLRDQRRRAGAAEHHRSPSRSASACPGSSGRATGSPRRPWE